MKVALITSFVVFGGLMANKCTLNTADMLLWMF